MITNVSTQFNNACIDENGALHKVRIKKRGSENWLNYQFDNFEFSQYCNPDSNLTIGTSCSAQVKFEVNGSAPNLASAYINVEIGVYIDELEDYEWIPYGTYRVFEQSVSSGTTKYTAYDDMCAKLEKKYKSDLTFPSTDNAMFNEIAEKTGLQIIKPSNFTTHTIPEFLKDYTYRETLAYLSAIQGCNIVIDNENKLKLVFMTSTTYKITDERIYQDSITNTNDEDFTVGYLAVDTVVDSEKVRYVAGNESSLTGIDINNPYMTYRDLTNDAYLKVTDAFTIRPCKIEMLGDIRLQVGDVVEVESEEAYMRIICMHITHKIDGGLITTVECFAKSSAYQDANAIDPISRTLGRYESKLLEVDKAVIKKLDAQEASITYATIEDLELQTLKLKALEDRVDGVVEIITVNDVPTLDNYPANTWFDEIYPPSNDLVAEEYHFPSDSTWTFSDETYKKHIGTIAYLDGTQYTYKFIVNKNGDYEWLVMSDTETSYILQKLTELEVTSDGLKLKVSQNEIDIKNNQAINTSKFAALDVTVDGITTRVSATEKGVKSNETLIEQTASSLSTRVTATENGVKDNKSLITQTATSLSSEITSTNQQVSKNKSDIAKNTSAIQQNASEISLKVSQTDYNGRTVASLINQSADSIKIQASHIKLEGLVTANDNVKIKTDGTIEAVNAVISGTLKAGSIIGASSSNKTQIGNWTLSGPDLYSWDSANNRGTGISAGGTNAIAAGFDNVSSWMNAPFRVTHAGKCYANDLVCEPSGAGTSKIGGFTINSSGIFYGSNDVSKNYGHMTLYPSGYKFSDGTNIFFLVIQDRNLAFKGGLTATGWKTTK